MRRRKNRCTYPHACLRTRTHAHTRTHAQIGDKLSELATHDRMQNFFHDLLKTVDKPQEGRGDEKLDDEEKKQLKKLLRTMSTEIFKYRPGSFKEYKEYVSTPEFQGYVGPAFTYTRTVACVPTRPHTSTRQHAQPCRNSHTYSRTRTVRRWSYSYIGKRNGHTHNVCMHIRARAHK